MGGAESSSSFEQAPARGFSLLRAGADHGEDERSTWVLALAGLTVAACAAEALCLSPRWFSYSMLSVVLQSARIVLTTAAIGGAAVWALWFVVSDKRSAGAMWIARNLSVGWVFLPCFMLLYQARSPWMLAFAALVAVGFALSLRRLLPLLPERAAAMPIDSLLPSLDGLPRPDSPRMLAVCAAVLLEAAAALAGVSMLEASLPLGVAVFLLTWRWSTYEVRAAEWWGGRNPPLRQIALAVAVTSLTLVPYTIGGRFGWHIRPPGAELRTPAAPPAVAAGSGYFGIILYPPPVKKALVAPLLHEEVVTAGSLAKPMVIPFSGPYWYFKDAGRRPGPRAHVAHGRPTDANINVRSTDLDAVMMEAHQKLSRAINLSACGEIDVAVTNGDVRPGEIELALVLTDSSLPGRPRQVLAARPVLSSLMDPKPQDRAAVKEALRFEVPQGAHLRRFDDVTVEFVLGRRHWRIGAKISVDSFELIPRRP